MCTSHVVAVAVAVGHITLLPQQIKETLRILHGCQEWLRTAMLGIERVGGVIVWCCLVVVNWFNAQFLHPIANWWLDSVLGTWEESTKSLLREFCAQSVRGLDLVVNALFGWFPGFQSTKTTCERPSAWQAWWAEDRQSTFNAIIERSERGGTQGPSDQPVYKDHKQPTSKGNQSIAAQRRWWSWRKQKGNTANNLNNSAHQPGTDNSAPQKKRKPDAEQSRHNKRIPAHKKIKRNGSDLFDRPAGWAVQEKTKRGFLEDWRIGVELAITSVFDAVRWVVRKVLFMPEKQALPPWGLDGRHNEWVDQLEDGDQSPPQQRTRQNGDMRRTNSFSNWEALHSVWTAAEVIKAAGYPLEQHTVITADGYKLRMERLPRTGGRDVVFFMHGILDTSMGWVSNGVTGSQAFAAFDQGFDVWLGNSRANPPREHRDKEMMGAKYWYFNVNQLGEEDIQAQLDFIHNAKCAELPKGLAEAAHAADAQRRRACYRVKKVTSENDISGLHPATSLDFKQTVSDSKGQPPTQATSLLPDKSEPGSAQQAATECLPRKRFGLFAGFRKRNQSESAVGSGRPSRFRLWSSKVPLAQQSPAIAECEDDNSGDDTFQSPSSQLAPGSPESASSPSPAAEADASPSHPADTFPALLHQPQLLQPQSRQNTEASSPPSSHLSQGTLVPQASSTPMSIPSRPHAQPSNQQSPGSSSAPSDLRDHIRCWPQHTSANQEDSPASPHQLPQASPSCHFEQGTASHEGHHAVRRSALHHSRSSRAKPDGGSGHGHGIRWNDSRESLLSSHDDLAQLVPDRASKGGVEQAPEVASFTELSNRRSSNGFTALSALPAMDGEQQETEQEGEEEAAQDEEDLVAAEQSKVKGTQSSKAGSRRSSHSGAHKEQGSGKEREPYRLRAVGHSLGGASLLIYAVTRCLKGQPTHLTRLILLTPAGFQQNYPKAALPFLWILPPLVWALQHLRAGRGAACYIPSSLLRYITFKLTVDMQQIPALNELVRAGLRVLLNGDSSQWDRAMQMPHYNTRSMPSISFHTGMHLIQWIRTGRFQLYDHKDETANIKAYGQATPTDIAKNYNVLRMPVDIMAGKSDGVIAKENVLMHYEKLQEANCCVTYKEFDFGHLDFTFAVKDDLRHYVLSRLLMEA